MAKLENYNGSVELMAGITQKGGGEFALVEANAVQTREDGTRLDAELVSIQEQIVATNDTTKEYVDSVISEIPTTQVVHGSEKELLSTIIETYILNIDYETLLAFDTSEVIIGPGTEDATSSKLGTGRLGYMILG